MSPGLNVRYAQRRSLVNVLLAPPEFPRVTSEADLVLQVYNGVRSGSYRNASMGAHSCNGKVAHSAAVNSNLKAGYHGTALSELCLVGTFLP